MLVNVVLMSVLAAALSVAPAARAATLPAGHGRCVPLVDAVCLPLADATGGPGSAPATQAPALRPRDIAVAAGLVALPPSAQAFLPLALGRHRRNFAVLWSARAFALWPQPAEAVFLWAAAPSGPRPTGQPAIGRALTGPVGVGGPVVDASEDDASLTDQAFRTLRRPRQSGFGAPAFPAPFFAGPFLPSVGGSAGATGGPATAVMQPPAAGAVPGPGAGAPAAPPDGAAPLAIPLAPSPAYLLAALAALALLPRRQRRRRHA